MSSTRNTEKNIVLRNRTVVIKKHLDTLEKKEILMKLIKEATGYNRVDMVKNVFDFFVMECVDDYYFRKPRLLSVIKEKLNDPLKIYYTDYSYLYNKFQFFINFISLKILLV